MHISFRYSPSQLGCLEATQPFAQLDTHPNYYSFIPQVKREDLGRPKYPSTALMFDYK